MGWRYFQILTLLVYDVLHAFIALKSTLSFVFYYPFPRRGCGSVTPVLHVFEFNHGILTKLGRRRQLV